MKKSIAVIGSNGFVGNAICNEILTSKKFNLIRITRNDNIEVLIKSANVVIYAANNSKRFQAENSPHLDFINTVEQAANI